MPARRAIDKLASALADRSLDYCVRPLSRHGGEGAIELLRTSCLHVLKVDAQRAGGSFHLSLSSCKTWVCRVPEDGYSGGVRDSLLQDLQLLAEDLRTGREGRTRDVPAWPPQAGDKPHLNRLAYRHQCSQRPVIRSYSPDALARWNHVSIHPLIAASPRGSSQAISPYCNGLSGLTAHSPGRSFCWTIVSTGSEIITSAFPFRISSKIVTLS